MSKRIPKTPIPVVKQSESDNGTTIAPGAGSFVDSAGNIFSIDAQLNAIENGKLISGGGGTGAGGYFNHTPYFQDATTKTWYTWTKGAFAAVVPPVVTPPVVVVPPVVTPPVVVVPPVVTPPVVVVPPVVTPPVAGVPPAAGPASLLAFFASIAGKHVVSGQFIETGDLTPIQTIETQTGEWLGLIGGDYWWYGAGTDTPAITSFNASAISYAKAGGLITLCLSMPNPQTGGGSPDTTMNLGTLLTAGSASNKTLFTLLDQVAAGLAELQAAGVTVILRPFHESNGNWFWWGTQAGTDAQFVQLWTTVHDYFTKTKGLTNLLWLFSVNAGLASGMPINGRYPGAAYVDMIGLDFYDSNPADAVGDYQTILAYGKPVCLAEFGSAGPNGGDTGFNEAILIDALQGSMPQIVFFQQWWSENSGGPGWGIEIMQNAKGALTNPYVLNRGQFTL